MAIHVLRGGVRHDVNAVFERTTVDGRGERVVDDERHAMAVRGGCEFVEIEHHQRRIGDGLAEHCLRVGLERRLELFLGAIRVHERAVDAHAAHGDVDEGVGAAVDGVRCNDVVARRADVEQREEVRRLAGTGQNRRGAAFELADFLRHHVIGGVGETGVEIAGFR